MTQPLGEKFDAAVNDLLTSAATKRETTATGGTTFTGKVMLNGRTLSLKINLKPGETVSRAQEIGKNLLMWATKYDVGGKSTGLKLSDKEITVYGQSKTSTGAAAGQTTRTRQFDAKFNLATMQQSSTFLQRLQKVSIMSAVHLPAATGANPSAVRDPLNDLISVDGKPVTSSTKSVSEEADKLLEDLTAFVGVRTPNKERPKSSGKKRTHESRRASAPAKLTHAAKPSETPKAAGASDTIEDLLKELEAEVEKEKETSVAKTVAKKETAGSRRASAPEPRMAAASTTREKTDHILTMYDRQIENISLRKLNLRHIEAKGPENIEKMVLDYVKAKKSVTELTEKGVSQDSPDWQTFGENNKIATNLEFVFRKLSGEELQNLVELCEKRRAHLHPQEKPPEAA